VVCAPENAWEEGQTRKSIEAILRDKGASSRTFKSALLFAVPDSLTGVTEEARKLLAWEDIAADEETLRRLDTSYQRQLRTNTEKTARDLREAIWRAYRHVVMIGKDTGLREMDLGLVHSSAAETITALILNRLRQEGDLEDSISPYFLARNWPAFTEWSTRSVRDAFFASPRFPRLLSADPIKETIAKGVSSGLFTYVGKTPEGDYEPFHYNQFMTAADVEFSEDVYLIQRETAESYQRAKAAPRPMLREDPQAEAVTSNITEYPSPATVSQTMSVNTGGNYVTVSSDDGTSHVIWHGEVPPQKWMNFYTRVLTKFATGGGLKLTVKVDISPEGGISAHKVEETRAALRELGLNDQIDTA
jgi:hypothetical protein